MNWSPEPEPGAPSNGIVQRPLRQEVQDAVRRLIVSGRFRPGDRLFEDQLAHELDVSRNPVREGLQALAAEGFVELEPRRGARVATVSPVRAAELFQVREALEGLVARLAAQRRRADHVTALRALAGEGEAALAASQMTELPALNTRFHRLLAATSGNELLRDELARLSHVIEWIYAERIVERSAESWAEHRLIVDAIADGDEDAAVTSACTHIANARDAYLSRPSS